MNRKPVCFGVRATGTEVFLGFGLKHRRIEQDDQRFRGELTNLFRIRNNNEQSRQTCAFRAADSCFT